MSRKWLEIANQNNSWLRANFLPMSLASQNIRSLCKERAEKAVSRSWSLLLVPPAALR